MIRHRTSLRGFTLLEILLVVAAIAILAGIIIVAINPARQLADTRDAQRHSDVEAISNAIMQYYIKNGAFPDTLPSHAEASCAVGTGNSYVSTWGVCTEGQTCDGFSLDSALVPDYIQGIPHDPLGDAHFSGYVAFRVNGGNHIYVCAPLTEDATIIGVLR